MLQLAGFRACCFDELAMGLSSACTLGGIQRRYGYTTTLLQEYGMVRFGYDALGHRTLEQVGDGCFTV